MARFQSQLCIGFHKKEDVIGDLEVPDDVLCAVALFTSGAN